MRRVAAAVCFLNVSMAGIGGSAPGDAHTANATVQVKVTVADACKLQTPTAAPPLNATGKTDLARESVLSGCSDRDAHAELSIAADSAREGSYVATVDF